jgi:hypothetical protein
MHDEAINRLGYDLAPVRFTLYHVPLIIILRRHSLYASFSPEALLTFVFYDFSSLTRT